MVGRIIRKIAKVGVLLLRRHVLSGGVLRGLIRKAWRPKRLNLGDRNGNFVCWGWETVDIADADYKVNFHDVRLPFQNESCQSVYSSAMIEHISDESASILFSEIHRVLQKGGTFRVVCPDLDKIVDAYRRKDHFYFLSNSVWIFEAIREGKIPKESFMLHNNVIRTLASYIDTGGGPVVDLETFDAKFRELDKYDFARWCVSLLSGEKIDKKSNLGHINAFDHSKLERMLSVAGFQKVARMAPAEYDNPDYAKSEFDRIENRLSWLCLFVEARK